MTTHVYYLFYLGIGKKFQATLKSLEIDLYLKVKEDNLFFVERI